MNLREQAGQIFSQKNCLSSVLFQTLLKEFTNLDVD